MKIGHHQSRILKRYILTVFTQDLKNIYGVTVSTSCFTPKIPSSGLWVKAPQAQVGNTPSTWARLYLTNTLPLLQKQHSHTAGGGLPGNVSVSPWTFPSEIFLCYFFLTPYFELVINNVLK